MDNNSAEVPEQKRMTLGEHLEELRSRVLIGLLSVGAAMIVCWILYERVIVDIIKAPLDMIAGRYDNPFSFPNPILDLIRGKLNSNMGDFGELKVLSVFEPVIVRFRVSLLAGIILASPIVIGQVWKFASSGLYPKERKYVMTYGGSSLFLFLGGCAFSFFFLFPVAAAVLLGGTRFGSLLRLEEYVSQATLFTLGVGLMFELPLVLLFLAKVGIVDIDTLRGKRRHVLLGILVASAMITPPDPLTQVIVAIPMLVLYEASILLLRIKGRKHEQEES